MSFSRFLAVGAIVSLLLHGTGSAFFATNPDEVSIAASEGGGVAVIGSIEDLVAGAKAEVVSETAPAEKIEPDTEPLDPVRETVKLAEVTPATPAHPIIEPVSAEVISPGAPVPLGEGVTNIEPVKAVEPSKPVQPAEAVKPVDKSLEQQPVEIARVDAAHSVAPVKPVTPQQEALRALEDPLAAVAQTPRTKPKLPVRKTEPKKTPDKKTRTAQARGADASSRKGGERVTSRTAHSNANGRANARSKDGGTQAASNYMGKVVAKLRRAKRYPPQARRKSLEGTARVAFTISRDGSVSGIRLAGSSGHALLDQAALDMVRRAAPMPKFPGDITGPRMSLQVPVRFSR